MARYNEILVGSLNRGLQKHLAMKGEPPAPQLGSEITPSLQLFLGTEGRYLFGWNRFSISSTIAEVGGVTANRFRLRNPAGSNAMGVVESLFVASGANADSILIALGAAGGGGNLPVVLTSQRLDSRIITASGSLVPSTDTSGGPGSPQIGIVRVSPAAQSMQLVQDAIHELTILPGDALEISQTTVTGGTALTVWMIWRERFLEDSERT